MSHADRHAALCTAIEAGCLLFLVAASLSLLSL